MSDPILFGAAYSVYVRIARLALAEKGVAYRLVEVDIFAEGGPPADYAARQPFGRIPAFEHDGFRLYESGAITRYVDEAFPGPPLQPAEPQARARVNQVAEHPGQLRLSDPRLGHLCRAHAGGRERPRDR